MAADKNDIIHTYYYNLDENIRNGIKEKLVKDLVEKISDPTWKNLHNAIDSFKHLYILVSAEENKRNKN